MRARSTIRKRRSRIRSAPACGTLQVRLLGDPADIRFDERVIVRAPSAAEDAFEVPVEVDARAIGDVEEIVISVDYGPIPKILTFRPNRAEPHFSFRFKIDQATPVRASVRTADGSWHVGGVKIDASGGGCTAPAAAYANADWEEHLGEVRGRMWPQSGWLRVIVDHPMDTGLADGIPVFIVENLELRDASGEVYAELDLFEPVDEDPAFTFHFRSELLTQALDLVGRDNNGNEIEATIPHPLTQ
ncbi:MAG: quinoprotein dehydrogenase-associated SoxYZ-like carrier [Geminicoccaceae bacterium]